MKKGQSLFEVVLALAVISLIVVGVAILSTNTIKNTTYSKNKTLASRYAQEAIEWLRSERDKDIANFRTKTTSSPVYCLDSLSWGNQPGCSSSEVISGTIFRREVTFFTSTVSGNKIVINASVRVYWQDSQGTHEVKSVTDFIDTRQL